MVEGVYREVYVVVPTRCTVTQHVTHVMVTHTNNNSILLYDTTGIHTKIHTQLLQQDTCHLHRHIRQTSGWRMNNNIKHMTHMLHMIHIAHTNRTLHQINSPKTTLITRSIIAISYVISSLYSFSKLYCSFL